MLNIDTLIKHYDEPFLELIEGFYIDNGELIDGYAGYYVNNLHIAFYNKSEMLLDVNREIIRKLAYLYNYRPTDDKSIKKLIKTLFERNLGICIRTIE